MNSTLVTSQPLPLALPGKLRTTSLVCMAFLVVHSSGFLFAQIATDPPSKEVTELLADYRHEFAKAKEPTDKILRTEATKIAAKLVAAGNPDGAKRVSAQVEEKISGRILAGDHAGVVNVDLVKLLRRYDSAVDFVVNPIRERYNSRVDVLLQGRGANDMDLIVSLGEAKKMINGDFPDIVPPSDEQALATESAGSDSIVTTPARGKKVLADLVEGRTWEFETREGIDIFTFEKRNQLRWVRAAGKGAGETTWKVQDDHIISGNENFEFRFDDTGSYGEVFFLTTKNRYRLTPKE